MVPLNLVLRKETGFKLRQNKTMSPAFSCRAHSCINRKPPARLMVVKRPITKIRAAISLRQADNVGFRPRKLARNAPSPHLSFQVKDHVQRDAGISGDPLGRIPVFQEVSRNLFNCIPTFKCHINHIHSLRHEISRTYFPCRRASAFANRRTPPIYYINGFDPQNEPKNFVYMCFLQSGNKLPL